MGEILTPAIYVLVFLAIVFGLQALFQIYFSARDRKHKINRRLTLLASGMEAADVYKMLVKEVSSPETGTSFIARYYGRFSTFCRQAGIERGPLEILSIFAGGALLLWLAALFIFRRHTVAGFVVSGSLSLLVSCALAGAVGGIWIGRRHQRRRSELEEQMPLALDVIVRAIRAGHPAVAAVRLASEEMGDPLGSEFGLVVDETTYGFEFRQALANFANRTGSPDAHFFAVSVGIQAETGGNLAEILLGLANVIRGRARLAKRVRALSSEGRASAYLLSALPALLIAYMMLFNPVFYTSKFSDPIFWPAVAVVGVLYLLGWIIIQRIIHFKY